MAFLARTGRRRLPRQGSGPRRRSGPPAAVLATAIGAALLGLTDPAAAADPVTGAAPATAASPAAALAAAPAAAPAATPAATPAAASAAAPAATPATESSAEPAFLDRGFAVQVGYARWIGSGWDEDGLAILLSLTRGAGRLLTLGVDLGYGHIGVPRADWLLDYSLGIPVQPAPSVAYGSLTARCGPRRGFARPFLLAGAGLYGTDLSGADDPRLHGGGSLGAGCDLARDGAPQRFRVEYRRHRLFSGGVYGRYQDFSDLTAGVVYGW